MTSIQSSFVSHSMAHGQRVMQQSLTDGAHFNALLESFSVGSTSRSNSNRADNIFSLNDTYGFIDQLFDKIHGSRYGELDIMGSPASTLFSFSSAFESTFGLSGPLPNFITMITSKLGLSVAQNLALQDISIRNKDIVKSNESVQKIAQELRAAGIHA